MRTEEQFSRAHRDAMAQALRHKKSFWVVPTTHDYVVSSFRPTSSALVGTSYLEVSYCEAIVQKARGFAIKKHGNQMYGSHPYVHHLDQVAQLVQGHGHGYPAQVIAYLHDVVEDTDTDLAEIEKEFGSLIARCVEVLTDEPGLSRAERKEKTYAKMAKISGEREIALPVKVADRLANTKSCVQDGKTDLLLMYRNEFDAFYRACYRENQCEDLWNELEAYTHSDPDLIYPRA